MKVRVAIPAANPPDNATDLTNSTFTSRVSFADFPNVCLQSLHRPFGRPTPYAGLGGYNRRLMMSVSSSRVPARREAWIGLGLVLSSILFCFAAAELAVRLFGSDDKRWELRNFIVEPLPIGNRWRVVQPDSELGYVPLPGGHSDQGGLGSLTFDERGLRVHHAGRSPRLAGSPILVMGDSYAMGEQVGDNETVPAHLEAMLDRPVLNGGVFGYGLDQIVLRAEKLVPTLAPGLLIVTFIADDVRRTQMRVLWGVPKPYFEIERGELRLRNVPVPEKASPYVGPVRSVLGYSFLADVIARRLDLESWWLRGQALHNETAHEQGPEISCLLMKRLRRLADAHRLRVIVVGQYTPNAWEDDSTLQFEIDGVAPVLTCAREQGLETLDSREAVERAVRADGVDRYYVDKHMSDAGNRLTADLIARGL